MRILPVVVAAALVATCAVSPAAATRSRAGTTLRQSSARLHAAPLPPPSPVRAERSSRRRSGSTSCRTARRRGSSARCAPVVLPPLCRAEPPGGQRPGSPKFPRPARTDRVVAAGGEGRRAHSAAGRKARRPSSTRGSTSLHPEFLGRPSTETLNTQEPVGVGGEHGTAVCVPHLRARQRDRDRRHLPEVALLRSWDAARGCRDGARHELGIVQGILAAAAAGPGVINLSLGSNNKEVPVEQAIDKCGQ